MSFASSLYFVRSLFQFAWAVNFVVFCAFNMAFNAEVISCRHRSRRRGRNKMTSFPPPRGRPLSTSGPTRCFRRPTAAEAVIKCQIDVIMTSSDTPRFGRFPAQRLDLYSEKTATVSPTDNFAQNCTVAITSTTAMTVQNYCIDLDKWHNSMRITHFLPLLRDWIS